MSLFNLFKKKEEKKIKKEPKKEIDKPVFTSVPVKDAAEKKDSADKERIVKKLKRKKQTRIAGLILKSPHIAEKPNKLAKFNQYVFKVFTRANKDEIKKAVEELYNVDVVKVRIIKIPRKKRRLGRIIGWRKGYKKAIVTIKKEQKIELLPR